MKIVIAEDEYISLMGLKANLEELGHEVIGEATDGLAAIKLTLEKQPDMIIMDVNMPLIDGIEALKTINEKYCIPSIIVSGYHEDKLIKRANEVGVYSYLIKPISEKDIKVAIETSMSRFNEYKKLSAKLKNTTNLLESRKYIEKAKGILMDTMNLKEPEAMRKLQKMSRDKNIKMIKLAKKIIEAKEILNN
ncbi:Fis family transcriptional regulator [Vallitalea longa]|uniref:Stage 0 sporulation protein A homolog n=1 Tax=Vallitalea longa TaxID=2936439 RepID=A0A9W5YDZ6_9FIRM|nr:response regulator [Vallitalea longa]GKX30896.1 Fis family transcriptional regulator [Vallitalea longa]